MKKWMLVMVGMLVVIVLAACGNKENTESQGSTAEPTGELKIVATNWKFDKETYTVKKGETLKVTLDSAEGAHAIKIKGLNVNVGTNASKNVTFDKAGEYEIECSIMCGAGHASMKSKIVVE